MDFTLPLAIFAFRGITKHRKCVAQSGSGGFRNTAHTWIVLEKPWLHADRQKRRAL